MTFIKAPSIVLALLSCLLLSCGGGNSSQSALGDNESANSQAQQSTENGPLPSIDDQSAEDAGEVATQEINPSTSLDTNGSEPAENELPINQTTTPEAEVTTDVPPVTSDESSTATEMDMSGTVIPPVPDETPQIEIGYSQQLPACEEAGGRIQSSVEIGMTEAQVLSVVGRPLDTGPSGDRWKYGRLGDPSVKFQPFYLDGRLVNGPVSGYDVDPTRCNYYQAEKDVPLREAANSLLTQSSNSDFSSETPTCFDAGVRVTALVNLGMTPTEVRSLVGKPVEVSIVGTIWDYGDGTFTPEVWFGSTIENGALTPTVVQGWDGDIRGCD